MKISVILLLTVGLKITLAGPSTIDPKFQLSFDGFAMFLKELAALRGRYQKVQETGRDLSSRIDDLETAVLKTNMTVGLPVSQIISVTEKTRNLDIRMKNLVDETRKKMVKIQENTRNTTSARTDLEKLADSKQRNILGLFELTYNLTQSIQSLNGSTNNLESEKVSFEKHLEGISNSTDQIEVMGCDSGFSYDNSGSNTNSRMTTLHFPRPFHSTPEVLYGLTRLDITVRYNSRMYVTNTLSGVNKSGLAINSQKDPYTTLRESEINWMTCYTGN